jgi:hypothetical protein
MKLQNYFWGLTFPFTKDKKLLLRPDVTQRNLGDTKIVGQVAQTYSL